jgi:hypothetical protein
VQFKALPALAALKYRLRLRNRNLEILFAARFDVDLRDFQ